MTEFDWNANNDVDMGDHTFHAEQIHNFYTLMFSLEVFVLDCSSQRTLQKALYWSKVSNLDIQAVHGIVSWNMNIVDEVTTEPNKAGQEYLRLTK